MLKSNLKVLIPLFSLLLFVYRINAELTTKYPEPNTIWKTGQEYELSWSDSDKNPNLGKKWNNMRIDIMTGDNINQKFVKNIGKNIDAKSVKSIKVKAPDVEPHSPIYFIMYSSSYGQKVWSTRFAITGEDGKVTPAEQATQPDGKPIPWGVGKLIKSANATDDNVPPPPMATRAKKEDNNVKKNKPSKNSSMSQSGPSQNNSIKLGYPIYLMAIAILIQFYLY